MLRIGGAAMVMISSFILSGALSEREKNRLAIADGLLSLVRFVRRQVGAFRRPLGEIWQTFSDEALAASPFLSVLRQRGIEAAVAALAAERLLEKEETDVLTAFARGLGKSDAVGEERLCEATEQALSALVEQRRKEAPQRTRVSQTLSICGGILILILLL